MTAPILSKPSTRDRAEIAAAYKWDVSAIYPDWEAWELDFQRMETAMTEYASLKGTLAQGSQAVLRAYRLADEIGKLQYKIFRYPQLQRDVDTRDHAVAGRLQRAQAAFARFGTQSAWFTPELLTIARAEMEAWLGENAGLAPYRFPILEAYRQREHTLDEQGEKLLSYSSRFNGTPAAIFQELSTSDIKFPAITLADGAEIVVSPANYQRLLRTNYHQPDRAKAFEAHLGVYKANENTYAAIYNGVLQRDWFTAQARGYPTTLAASLDADAVPQQVVETLIEVVREGTEPLRRYHRLRKRLLKLETYDLYDASIPAVEFRKLYPYDEAKAVVLESIAPLGAEYRAKMAALLDDGRIDVYENEGKRSGAYSAGVYGVGPYMLLNYNDTLDALFTLAHELGHSLHTVLSYETQPFATASYTIFVAEVASTTNERFLLDHLLARTTDPKERYALLQNQIEGILGTFYTQVMFADFELQAHRLAEQGQPVTPAVLRDIYGRLLRDYYGDSLAQHELYRLTWARIPHFYNTPYYVYQYATCFASSAKLHRDMTTGPQEERAAALARYLELLRSGGNDEPMKQLLKAGVDLTRRETVQAVVGQLDALVTQLEAEAARL